MEWVEFTPDQVAKGIVHVVMTAVLIWITFLCVALQLQALDHSGAHSGHLQPDLPFAIL
jgi:hypothetical protein